MKTIRSFSFYNFFNILLLYKMNNQTAIQLYDELVIQQNTLLQKSKKITDEKESKLLNIEISNINSLIKSLTKYMQFYKFLNK